MIAETLRIYFGTAGDRSVLAAYLFGSEAAGRSHRESDVDVAVLLDRARARSRDERAEAQLRIATDLIALLHRNAVDVVILNDAAPLFARAVLRNGALLIVRDRTALRDFERDVQLRAADLEPFIERGRRRILEALRGDPAR
jgi:predicted nucleotidyltransferase